MGREGGMMAIKATPRQLQILELAAAGHSDKQIAQLLGISVATVRTHFGRVFNENGFRNRTEAVSQWLSSSTHDEASET
jgi:DNA-binding CsgD family transcriptional regulator